MTIETYKNHIIEKYNSQKFDINKFTKGGRVKFWWLWNNEPELLEGIIKVIDYDGGGICFNITPSFDIDCDGVLYKHISIVDIEPIDPFFSEMNTERLRKNAAEMDKSGGTIHEVN